EREILRKKGEHWHKYDGIVSVAKTVAIPGYEHHKQCGFSWYNPLLVSPLSYHSHAYLTTNSTTATRATFSAPLSTTIPPFFAATHATFPITTSVSKARCSRRTLTPRPEQTTSLLSNPYSSG